MWKEGGREEGREGGNHTHTKQTYPAHAGLDERLVGGGGDVAIGRKEGREGGREGGMAGLPCARSASQITRGRVW